MIYSDPFKLRQKVEMLMRCYLTKSMCIFETWISRDARNPWASRASGASFCTPCARGDFNDQEAQGSCQNCQPGLGMWDVEHRKPQEVGFELRCTMTK